MASTKAAYASNVPSEIVDPSFTVNGNPLYEWSEPFWSDGSWNNFGSSTTSSLYYRAYGYSDYYIKRTISSGAYDVSSFNKDYKGYVELQEKYYLDTWCISESNVDCINFYYMGCEVDTAFPYSVVDRSTKSVNFGDAGSQYWNNQSGKLTFNANTKVVFQDADFSHYCYIQILYKFRVYWVSSSGSSYPSNVNFNYYSTYNSTNVSYRISRTDSDKYYLYNIYNGLQNDSSGNAAELASEVSSYDTAESLASTSMAGALPSADTQLSQITQYDYGSLYTDNVSAFAFWKSLGDFVLSNSNLVGIGALLILCLFLGLVVYLLRL